MTCLPQPISSVWVGTFNVFASQTVVFIQDLLHGRPVRQQFQDEVSRQFFAADMSLLLEFPRSVTCLTAGRNRLQRPRCFVQPASGVLSGGAAAQ